MARTSPVSTVTLNSRVLWKFHVVFSVTIIPLELGENQDHVFRKGVESFD